LRATGRGRRSRAASGGAPRTLPAPRATAQAPLRPNRLANPSLGLLEPPLRLRPGHARSAHHDGHLERASGAFEPAPGLRVARAGRVHEDALRALLELPARGLEIHHEILVDLAEPHHRPRREHVENELLRRPRL